MKEVVSGIKIEITFLLSAFLLSGQLSSSLDSLLVLDI